VSELLHGAPQTLHCSGDLGGGPSVNSWPLSDRLSPPPLLRTRRAGDPWRHSALLLLIVFTFAPASARGIVDCAVAATTSRGSDFELAIRTLSGDWQEAESWSIVVIGTVTETAGGSVAGYRRVTIGTEAVFKGEVGAQLVLYYPVIDEEDGFGFHVGRRYFITAGHNRFAPGLATDQCSPTQEISAAEAVQLLGLADAQIHKPIPTQFAESADAVPVGLLVGTIVIGALATAAIVVRRRERAA